MITEDTVYIYILSKEDTYIHTYIYLHTHGIPTHGPRMQRARRQRATRHS